MIWLLDLEVGVGTDWVRGWCCCCWRDRFDLQFLSLDRSLVLLLSERVSSSVPPSSISKMGRKEAKRRNSQLMIAPSLPKFCVFLVVPDFIQELYVKELKAYKPNPAVCIVFTGVLTGVQPANLFNRFSKHNNSRSSHLLFRYLPLSFLETTILYTLHTFFITRPPITPEPSSTTLPLRTLPHPLL